MAGAPPPGIGPVSPWGYRKTYKSEFTWEDLLRELERQTHVYVDPHFYSEDDAIRLEEAAKRLNEIAREVRERVDIAREERAVGAASLHDDGC